MRGIYSFSIVILMLLILTGLLAAENSFYLNIEAIEKECIATENASKERTILENNVDKLVETKLLEQVKKESPNPKEEINQFLSGYLAGKASAYTAFLKEVGPVTPEFLKENSESFFLEVQGVKYGEYVFTSNIGKTLLVAKKLGGNSPVYFMVPVGYTVKVVV